MEYPTNFSNPHHVAAYLLEGRKVKHEEVKQIQKDLVRAVQGREGNTHVWGLYLYSDGYVALKMVGYAHLDGDKKECIVDGFNL